MTLNLVLTTYSKRTMIIESHYTNGVKTLNIFTY